jgi:hypothetical protein
MSGQSNPEILDFGIVREEEVSNSKELVPWLEVEGKGEIFLSGALGKIENESLCKPHDVLFTTL